MAIFVDTYNRTSPEDILMTFPSYVDPLFLTLIVLLSLPGILLNPIVMKSRIARISNSIPALLTTCLCGVYLIHGVFISTSWIYFIVKDTPNQNFDNHNATAFNQVYTFWYCSGNLYSTALLYLMAFSRYRAIADPFDAIQYKEILRKVIGFGIITVVLSLVAAAITVFTADEELLASKFSQIVNSIWYIVPDLLILALLISSLQHIWRTIKILRQADDTPEETREQRRNGVKMVLALVGGQIAQVIIGIIWLFNSSHPYIKVTLYCLFQCFQASYTAVVLLFVDKGTQSEVKEMFASVKKPEYTGESGGAVTAVETVLE